MKKKALLILTVVFLAGCAAMGVPYTSDPIEKLQWSDALLKQGRPLPAENLIVESVKICKEKNDTECLGEAYAAYGFFFRSNAVERYSKRYREDGFRDKNATYIDRFVQSEKYFKMAILEFSKTNKYDRLTNAYLELGHTYHLIKDRKSECSAYDTSITYNTKYEKDNPTAKIHLPKEYSTYQEYIIAEKKWAKCNKKNIEQIVDVIVNGIRYTPSEQRAIKESYMKKSIFESSHSGEEEDKTTEFILLSLKKAIFNSSDNDKDSSYYDIYISTNANSEDYNQFISSLTAFIIPVTSTYKFNAEVIIRKDGRPFKTYNYTTDVERNISHFSELQAYKQEAIQEMMRRFLIDIERDKLFVVNTNKEQSL